MPDAFENYVYLSEQWLTSYKLRPGISREPNKTLRKVQNKRRTNIYILHTYKLQC